MSFNLKPEEGQEVMAPRVNYQRPGIAENVMIDEIEFGKSSVKQSPYIRIKTVGQHGELGKSPFMWLTTEKGTNLDGTPKKTTGWAITAKNITDLICATHNDMSRQDAEAIELIPANAPDDKDRQCEMLVAKLSTLLVGKPFRAKFKGEQSQPNGTIFATMDKVESMSIPKSMSSLRFNETNDIKLFVTTPVDTTSPF